MPYDNAPPNAVVRKIRAKSASYLVWPPPQGVTSRNIRAIHSNQATFKMPRIRRVIWRDPVLGHRVGIIRRVADSQFPVQREARSKKGLKYQCFK